MGISGKDKSQVFHLLRSYLAMVRTQFEKGVKFIRTDNGTKFLNSNFQVLFNELGIVHSKTCTYTPQQNGVVERRHRTILGRSSASCNLSLK